MHRTRGFLLAGPMLYGAIGVGIVVVGLSVALKIQSSRLESCKTNFEAFKLQTKLIGENAAAAAKRREEADRLAKEKSDAQFKNTIARLNRDIQRVRDDSRRSVVPPAPPASSRPDLACFDRPEFDRAVSGFITEVTEFVGEGATRTVELDSIKEWSNSVLRQRPQE